MVKNPPVNTGDAGSIPELGRSLMKERATNSPGKSHGQRSLPDYSRWGREVKNNSATEHACTLLGIRDDNRCNFGFVFY